MGHSPMTRRRRGSPASGGSRSPGSVSVAAPPRPPLHRRSLAARKGEGRMRPAGAHARRLHCPILSGTTNRSETGTGGWSGVPPRSVVGSRLPVPVPRGPVAPAPRAHGRRSSGIRNPHGDDQARAGAPALATTMVHWRGAAYAPGDWIMLGYHRWCGSAGRGPRHGCRLPGFPRVDERRVVFMRIPHCPPAYGRPPFPGLLALPCDGRPPLTGRTAGRMARLQSVCGR